MDSLKLALNSARDLKTKKDLLTRIAVFYAKQKNDSAIYFLNLLSPLVLNKSSDKEIAYYYYLRARYYSDKEKYIEAITLCDSCLAHSKDKNQLMQYADCESSKSIAFYYIGNNELGIKSILKTIPIYLKLKDFGNLSDAYVNLANFYQRSNKYSEALIYFNKAIGIADTLNNLTGACTNYLNFGIYYEKLGDYTKSLECFLKSLRYAERGNISTALILTDIGNSYNNLSNFYEAEKFLNLAVQEIEKGHASKTDAVQCYQALAVFYQNLNQFKKSEEPLRKAMKQIDIKNSPLISSNIFNAYSWTKAELGQFDEAIDYINKAIEIRLKLKDFNGLAESYDYFAFVFEKKGDLNKALKYYKIGYNLADSINHFIFRKNYCASLSNILVKMNNYKEAHKYLSLYMEYQDKINNENISNATAQMQAIYESEKKEKNIQLLKNDRLLQDVQLNNQKLLVNEKNFQRNMLLAGVALLVVVLSALVIGFLQKKKANIVLNEKNNLIQIQKQLVEEHQKETVDSINYARRIQYALLANKDLLDRNLANYFVMFQPKDIVSGDFYWATEDDDKLYLAVCDSTGHGVPGAFMSLLNMGFLNEAIKEKNIKKPNEILNYVRKRLIDSLSSEGQQDGMDAILVCISKSNNVITYAAANNAPLLVRDGQFIELPKDKMPVGKGERTESFTLQQLDAKSGDMLYLYTDGYADQFGGPKGKKFKYKPLNELLIAINNQTLNNQKQMLDDNFINWKGDLEQVDDVCIIGIRL